VIGDVNRYTCERCKGSIFTVDQAEGVTPFMLACRATEGCSGWMQSGFYDPRFRFLAPQPKWEWVQRGPDDIPHESLKLQPRISNISKSPVMS
jgi:hypothetical protein